jgi:hypothetical protein
MTAQTMTIEKLEKGRMADSAAMEDMKKGRMADSAAMEDMRKGITAQIKGARGLETRIETLEKITSSVAIRNYLEQHEDSGLFTESEMKISRYIRGLLSYDVVHSYVPKGETFLISNTYTDKDGKPVTLAFAHKEVLRKLNLKIKFF